MGNGQLQISRQLDAPLERVWEVWTDPRHIAHWWGPAGFTNTIDKMEVTEGGEWEFTMHGPDGSNYRNKHIYLQVTRNEKLVLDHITAPKFEMHVSFTPLGDKTLVEIQSIFQSAEQLEQVIKVFRADEGMRQNMDRLEAYLKTL